jgi:peroxiredoxin
VSNRKKPRPHRRRHTSPRSRARRAHALAPAASIDGSFVPRPRRDVASVELDGEAVLAAAVGDPPSVLTHWLNATGTIVWSCFDGQASLDELIADLSDAFGVDEQIVRVDVVELTQGLGRAGLLQGVEAEVGRQHAHSETSTAGLPLGTEVAPFALADLEGERVGLEALRGRRFLLVNWSPACVFCLRIAGELAELVPALRAHGVDLILMATGSADDNRGVLSDSGLDCTVLLDHDADVDLFRGLGTPCAYLVDEEGKIASNLALGAIQVPALAKLLVET